MQEVASLDAMFDACETTSLKICKYVSCLTKKTEHAGCQRVALTRGDVVLCIYMRGCLTADFTGALKQERRGVNADFTGALKQERRGVNADFTGALKQ